jgi:hypothetical protein
MDNSSIHRSNKMREKEKKWLAKGLTIFYYQLNFYSLILLNFCGPDGVKRRL